MVKQCSEQTTNLDVAEKCRAAQGSAGLVGERERLVDHLLEGFGARGQVA
jgi:hypothetical protein